MSKELRADVWSRHQQYMSDYVKYFKNDPKEEQGSAAKSSSYSKKELDILHENHRFLRNDDENHSELTWEQRLAKKYYDKLYKEYALVELKFYKIGKIAMRWRTEKEVIRGKGQFTCGSLQCDEPRGLSSWEVNFAYVEDGVKKNALVKVRLCEACSDKLNYTKMHNRAPQPTSRIEHSSTKGSDSSKSRSESQRSQSRNRRSKDHSRERRRSRSSEREGSTRRNKSRSISRDRTVGAERTRESRWERKDYDEADSEHRRGQHGRPSASPERRRKSDRGKETEEDKGSAPTMWPGANMSESFETFFAGLFD